MKRVWTGFIFVALIAAGCRKEPVPDGNEPVTMVPGFYDKTLVVDGTPRDFRYYVPDSFSTRQPIRLTFLLHGLTWTGPDVLGTYIDLLAPEASRCNSLIIAPTALYGHWNDRLGGSFPPTDTVDDVKFIQSIADHFSAIYPVCEPSYCIIGISNGAMMAYRMACDLPEKINAIAPFIAMQGAEAASTTRSSPPVPVFITNGTLDPIMKWDGGLVSTETVPLLGVLLSNEENIQYWIQRNQSDPNPEIDCLPDYCNGDNSRVITYTYHGAAGVVFNKVVGGGHYVPKYSALPVVPGYNCDFESMIEAFRFLHRL